MTVKVAKLYIHLGLCTGAFLILTPLLSCNSPAGSSVQSRPNILLILADDHSCRAISSYGSATISTPAIDRLAAEGMSFTRMMVTNSLCAPSRAVLLTGRYSHVNGMKSNQDRFDGSQQTFPKLLQEAGFETCIIGKWHLRTQPEGFDYYALMNGQGRYFDCPLKDTAHPWESRGKVHEGYLTDVITDRAIRWLDTRNTDKPFCLLVHHKAPHGPHDPAPRHKDLFSDSLIPEPPSLYDDYQGRVPSLIEDQLVSSRMAICRYPQYREEIKKYAGDREEATRHMYQVYMKGYLRLVKALDENVGRLLDHLEQSGLAQNTLVIYTSDNGFFNGEHGFFNKMWMYEPSMRVPFIVRLPGVIEAGTTNDALCCFPDVTATLLDMAETDIPGDWQGRSMKNLFRQDEMTFRDAVYYHYYEAYGVPEQYGVRTSTHKLIHFPGMPEAHSWELFDLQEDPCELNDLHDSPDGSELFSGLYGTLDSLIISLKDPVSLIPQ